MSSIGRSKIKKIAIKRINYLLELAKKILKENPELSKRYVELARKMGLRANIRIKNRKRIFCKNCNTIFIPGYNCMVRLNSREKCVRIICLNCKRIYRYGYRY